MISPSVIDEVTFWLSSTLLSDPVHETDRMAVERIALEARGRPLGEVVSEIGGQYREDSGEFGLGQEAFLLASIVVPAVHGFVSSFAAKFFEGAGRHRAASLRDVGLFSHLSHFRRASHCLYGLRARHCPFFAEHHPAIGTAFVGAQLGVFALVVAVSLRRRQKPPTGTPLVNGWKRSVNRIPFAPCAQVWAPF
jgi:hypothetical protein